MKKPREAKQAEAFITALHNTGWRSMTSFETSGHVFELLMSTKNNRALLVQVYPEGHGFEVWRPVTQSATIAETAAAVAAYGVEQ